MNSKMSKLAAAAVIIIGVIIGSQLFISTGGLTLAEVYEKVQQVVAYSYRVEEKIEGTMTANTPSRNMECDTVVTISTEHGMIMEINMKMLDTGQTTHQQMYIMPQEKLMVMLMPDQKMYTRMTFEDDLLDRIKNQNNDPRAMVRRMLDSEYTELGPSEIDGVSVQGFETTDLAYASGMANNLTAKLWVDTQTGLLFRGEIEMQLNENTHMKAVLLDFQWNIEASADDFIPVIPEDYKTVPGGDLELPKMDAESAINGLRFFAEISGRYPENLSIMTLIKECGELIKSDSPVARQLQQRLKEAESDPEAGAALEREIMIPVQSLLMFYMALVQDKKEPVYYGKSVGPGESDKILLRWKLEDDLYSVVYGDLRTEDVTAERLAELEQQ